MSFALGVCQVLVSWSSFLLPRAQPLLSISVRDTKQVQFRMYNILHV